MSSRNSLRCFGAALSHVFPDGVERPIAYASRTLSQSEKGYAQKKEKEALSLIFGIKKFRRFVYDRKVTLVIDRKLPTAMMGTEH